MSIRTILYFFLVPLTLYALTSLDFNRFLKQGKVIEARLLYLLLCLGISYLAVNFFMDFFYSTVTQY